MLALLSPDGVPRALLTALTKGDATVLDDRIHCLAGGLVITHTEDRSALEMHRLVARVIRDRHRAEDDYPALISTTVRMLGTAVFPEALAHFSAPGVVPRFPIPGAVPVSPAGPDPTA